jgi:hypothetical protein
MPGDLHEEFRELCALSTTGELTAEEWARLTEHLAQCDSCRRASQEYDRLIAMALPAMGVASGSDLDGTDAEGAWSIEDAQERLMESLKEEPVASAERPARGHVSALWKYWWRYAVAALILAACTLTAYRLGRRQGHGSDTAQASTGSTGLKSPPPIDAMPAHEKVQQPEKSMVAVQNVQARRDHQEVARLNNRLAQLERELSEQGADLDRSLAERADLNRRLTEAQSNSLGLEARLSLLGKATAEDTQQALALKEQVNDLNQAIEEKNKQIQESRELLDRDQDVRNLIGARNLYIAEIYDVGQSGDTQKPFGRVFYTKDKSLVFYGYDLDQQPGIKKASAFQAWGGRGSDRQHAVSLGLLYKDDANQKRWVLKSNDARTISQIDAVFVTVEPQGGSSKPSGKPLLFTYLRLDPNHP